MGLAVIKTYYILKSYLRKDINSELIGNRIALILQLINRKNKIWYLNTKKHLTSYQISGKLILKRRDG